MKLYNTLTRKKESFESLTKGRVSIYVCGITAYDNCHLGHARSALVFDMISRYFTWRGFQVRYVKNFTDIDDKIIAKANKEGKSIQEISQRYIAEHDRDMAALGIEKPTETPLATAHIDEIISLIAILLEKGIAYVTTDGDVYFSIDKFADYGKLSGRNIEEMLAGARVEIGEKKKNPLDFALWKAAKENEPWWQSPWSKGRPGWHIECSAMSKCLLGETFDIHGGGADLVFPHHENEIAQSQAAFGKMPAKYWLHNGFVRISGEKMSKSLGNFLTIKEVLNFCHPEVLRFFMLQFHYRSPIDFSLSALAEARVALNRCYRSLEATNKLIGDEQQLGSKDFVLGNDGDGWKSSSPHQSALGKALLALPERFQEAMDDDFNSAKAFGVIFDFVRTLNGALTDKGFLKSANAMPILRATRHTMLDIGKILGIFTCPPQEYFREDTLREANKLGLDINMVEGLLEERRQARECKDWARSDEIRNRLAELKVQIQDSPNGTSWFIE